MTTRNQILQYLIDEYYEGDAAKNIRGNGLHQSAVRPHGVPSNECHENKQSKYLIHCVFTPKEFKVIVEFGEFHAEKKVATQLKA